ncbi:MAG: acetate/propionate family kinase [Desulfobacteraceae bacterium]|nr:acetate/propionate family kinase [Desulfobacteraceae bacterium]
MKEAIAVINGGSSSIKFSLYEIGKDRRLESCCRGQIEGIGVDPNFTAKAGDGKEMGKMRWKNHPDVTHRFLLSYLIDWTSENFKDLQVKAVGHRVVHGGAHYREPVRVDEKILEHLGALAPLAPLHQPHNLAPIAAIAGLVPDVPQVACFDTAFHSTHTGPECHFALPRKLTAQGVRRYGFHGLSYEYIADRLPEYDKKAAAGRTVVLHLGSGASMCALKGGKSVASTMGFSAADGLPMGTRTGTMDPGVLLYLMQEKKMGPWEMETLLYRESGLLGVSGISNDMRVLLENESPKAMEAVDLFVYRIRKELGGFASVLEGLDAVVFTAGIGENAPEIRRRICEKFSWLGLELDDRANLGNGPRISTPGSRVSAWVIPTDEEIMIARHVLDVIGG